MATENSLNQAKGERALKLLEESDPELAELVQEKLNELEDQKQPAPVLRLPVNPEIIPPRFTVKKAGFSLPQVWPLSIDKSFWADWAFVKWQALRRNRLYRRSMKKAYKLNPTIFDSTQIGHLFRDYTPPSRASANPLLTWRTWPIRQSFQTNVE